VGDSCYPRPVGSSSSTVHGAGTSPRRRCWWGREAEALDGRAFNVADDVPLPLGGASRGAVLQATGAREAGRLPYSPRPARVGSGSRKTPARLGPLGSTQPSHRRSWRLAFNGQPPIAPPRLEPDLLEQLSADRCTIPSACARSLRAAVSQRGRRAAAARPPEPHARIGFPRRRQPSRPDRAFGYNSPDELRRAGTESREGGPARELLAASSSSRPISPATGRRAHPRSAVADRPAGALARPDRRAGGSPFAGLQQAPQRDLGSACGCARRPVAGRDGPRRARGRRAVPRAGPALSALCSSSSELIGELYRMRDQGARAACAAGSNPRVRLWRASCCSPSTALETAARSRARAGAGYRTHGPPRAARGDRGSSRGGAIGGCPLKASRSCARCDG